MTTEREAMTLERQAFEKWAKNGFDLSRNPFGMYEFAATAKAWIEWQRATDENSDRGDCSVCGAPVAYGTRHHQCGAAIMEAEQQGYERAKAEHLSRAAEPVYQIHTWSGMWFDVPKCRYEAEQERNRRVLYTHPPEPADAKDADVERVARAIYAHVFDVSIPRIGVRTATFEEVWNVPAERERMLTQARAAIAAMAQESGDAT